MNCAKPAEAEWVSWPFCKADLPKSQDGGDPSGIGSDRGAGSRELMQRRIRECIDKLILILRSAESSGPGDSGPRSIRPEDLRPILKCDQAPLAIASVILSFDPEATDIERSSVRQLESCKFNSLSTIHNVFGDHVRGLLTKLLARKVRAHIQREDLMVCSQCDLASALAFALLCRKDTIEPDDLVFTGESFRSSIIAGKASKVKKWWKKKGSQIDWEESE